MLPKETKDNVARNISNPWYHYVTTEIDVSACNGAFEDVRRHLSWFPPTPRQRRWSKFDDTASLKSVVDCHRRSVLDPVSANLGYFSQRFYLSQRKVTIRHVSASSGVLPAILNGVLHLLVDAGKLSSMIRPNSSLSSTSTADLSLTQ